MTKLTEAWRERTTTERRRRQQRTQNFTVEGNTIQPKIRTATIRTIRDAIVKCAQKPTRVSLIYHTEPTTKKWKNRKTKKVKNGYAQKRRKTVRRIRGISPEEEKVGYDGKDLQKRKVLSLGWKSEGVMDDESCESMELMEEVSLIGLGESEWERLVCGWRREAGLHDA